MAQQQGELVNRNILIQGQNSVSNCDCSGTHVNNTSEIPTIKIRKITCKKSVVKLSYELAQE